MAKSNKLSMAWYYLFICFIVPVGGALDLLSLFSHVSITMFPFDFIAPVTSGSAGMDFLFIFMSSFFIFYRVIGAVLLTGRISAGPNVMTAMYIMQVIYLLVYGLMRFFGVGGFDLFTILLLVLVVLKIVVMIVNKLFFLGLKNTFDR